MRDAHQPYPQIGWDSKGRYPDASSRQRGATAGGDATASCLTCAREKPVADYLFAPLWPRALGGEAAPAPFQSGQICKACREIADTRIDGAFLKSWVMQAELARAAQSFLDPALPGPGPLAYLGTVSGFPGREGEFCDRWSGLAGEAIYHVHRRRDDGWAGFGGAQEGASASTQGEEATLVLTSASLFWSKIALESFAAHFPHVGRFCVNEIPGLKGLETGLAQPRHRREIAWLAERGSRATLLNSGLRHDYSHRFLIKLALGVGSGLFGRDFTQTAHARALRRNFWQPQPKLRGFGEAKPVFSMPGAWALCLMVQGNVLGLAVLTPTGQRLDIAIADEPSLWAAPEHASLAAGQVYIAIPPRGVFVGPLALPQCLAHQAGESMCAALDQLDAMRKKPRQLPSKQGFA